MTSVRVSSTGSTISVINGSILVGYLAHFFTNLEYLDGEVSLGQMPFSVSQGFIDPKTTHTSVFRLSTIFSFAAALSLSVSGDRLSKVHTLTRLPVTLCVAG